MRSLAARSGARRAVAVASGALVLILLGFLAFRGLGREVEPVEVTTVGTATEGRAPSTAQAVQTMPERDAIDVSSEHVNSSYASATTGSEVAPPEAAEVIVWGFVRDRDGQPVESAGVSFVDSLGERRSVEVAADGSYSMPGLEAGRWFVRAGTQGFLDAEGSIDVPPERARIQRDFTLEPRPSLSVRVVTPDGRAFRDADVDPSSGKPRRTWLIAIATTEPPNKAFIRFNHNSRYGAGKTRFQPDRMSPSEDGSIATLDLFAPLPLFVSLLLSEELIATQQVPPGSSEVVFVLDPSAVDAHFGALHLTFVDAENRAPIQQANISLEYPGGGMSPLRLDEGGRTALRRCAPGRYEISTLVSGFASSSVSIDLAAGEVVERTIELARGVEVTGRCVDELDRPIAGEFAISPSPAPGELPRQLEEDGSTSVVATKDDGVIELRMEPGVWLLQPQERRWLGDPRTAPRLGANLVLDTRSGPVTNLVVRLLPPSSVVVNWSGSDRDEVRLWFLDEAGIVRSAEKFWSSAPSRCALPPGLWQVRVLDPNDVVREERNFTLGAEPVVLELGPAR